MQSIFEGVKVLDLTKVFSGPFATRLLADYGAQVLKIEPNDHPDDSRQYPPLKNEWSGYYEILNRNKTKISLNLKNEKEKAAFYNLVKTADVVVENLTPQTKHKLSIDYDTLSKINPKLIYASLSGAGQKQNKKYYDIIVQAESGLMSLSGTPRKPVKIGPSVVDAFSGVMLSFAISSALYFRERTGLGQYLDVSMLAASMNLLESNLIAYSVTGINPKRTGNLDNLIAPFGVYKAKDGYIVLAIGNEKQWGVFITFFKEYLDYDKKLFSDNAKRLQNQKKLTSFVEKVFRGKTVTELLSILEKLGISCTKVNEMSDVYNNGFLQNEGAVKKIMIDGVGECMVPGFPINFSNASPVGISSCEKSI